MDYAQVGTRYGFKDFKNKFNYEFWQKFSKALIIVVAVMPAAGILISIGRLLNPGFINVIGGDLPSSSPLFQVGGIIESLGWTVIGNLGFLFAVAIAGNWSNNKAGGAFAGALAYLMFHTVVYPMANLFYGYTGILDMSEFSDVTLGLTTLKGSQVFSGIALGFISGIVYNNYFDFDKLPGALSFFNGARFVPLATIFFSVVTAFVFAVLWPWIETVILAIGTWLAESGGFFYAPFIYGTMERLMLPFGLHHMITIPMNYTDLGGVYLSVSGLYTAALEGSTATSIAGQDPLWLAWINDVSWMENVLNMPSVPKNPTDVVNSAGDITDSNYAYAEFINQLTLYIDSEIASGAITGITAQQIINEMNSQAIANGFSGLEEVYVNYLQAVPARFKTGQVVDSTFILPAIAIAFYYSIPKENRSANFSFYFAAAFSVAIAGITEPIEFMFAFTSPVLYIIYSFIVGLAWGFVDVMRAIGAPIRIHAFGLIEFVARSPLMLSTSLWLDWVIFWVYGAIWFGVFLAVFYFYSKSFKPDVPGMLDSPNSESIEASNDSVISKESPTSSNKKKTSSGSSKKDNDSEIIETIIKYLGGVENIKDVTACFTRLRVTTLDSSKVNIDGLKKDTAAMNVFIKGKGVQVVYGPKADIYSTKINAKYF